MSQSLPDTSVEGVTRYGLFIDNQQIAPIEGEYLDVVNPASGAVWAQVPNASAKDVDVAVESARRAFVEGDWPAYRAADRAKFLIRFGEAIADNAEEIAQLQVNENGKLIREMVGQAKLMPEYFNYYAGLAQMPTGSTNPLHVQQMLNYTVREPLGVVAAITPWNSPLLLLVWKLGPALAAGNTVIAKPSEVTPASAIRFAQLAAEVGLPPGVFNVVTGLGHPSGTALTGHPGVDKIAFTGSTATGQAIASQAGKTLKRVSLELGGKSPNIVFDDADLTSAVNGLVAGIFGASGQTCMAGSRILVQDAIYDQVVDELRRRAEAIKVGDPQDPASEMGTVACRPQYEKVLSYVDVAKADGARLVAGGTTAEVDGFPDGLFVRPTVFADVTNDMRIAQEEVFGPIAALIRFSDEDEAVRIANDTQFGLAAGVWTGNVQRAHRVASRLRAGTVWINNYRKTSYATPFGGYKQSGLGRENGADALREYTEEKSVWVDTGQGVKDPFNPRA
ncbi:aldehyde dehydrogenase [Amycolatopsis methanolica]|uniref:Aldehyde dehydrogenase (NAD(+)) n=1 Tax=Amycolatopsis methanolica 239 TaxID=1068978 RepID=A0A076MVT6_AMYME|nr:aldehyde dehydrogenase [Amycolatopsis methanolica]AIJ21897.1 aldehyde dehydrogenase (NAD(+)) [Amycolatopsis methanolica 239]